MKDSTTEPFDTANSNAMLCADLISKEFENNLTYIFNQLGETIFKKGAVLSIIKSYYVMLDLKGKIPLIKIEEYRLNHFHTFLWGYILKNPADEKSKKLWEIIDERLAEICT